MTPTLQPVRVLIVDDHAGIREMLAEALQLHAGIEVVGQAGSGAEALALGLARQPDVVMLDLILPDTNGLECVRAMRKHQPAMQFLVFTGSANPVLIDRAVELGVNGYIEKTAPFTELVEAVRTVASGGTHFGQSVRPTLLKFKKSPFPQGSAARLSPREHSILAGIALGKSSKVIAGELGLSLFTVNNHRRRIKNKTGLQSTSDLTLHALRLGLIPDAVPSEVGSGK